jgi:hypothetical protein
MSGPEVAIGETVHPKTEQHVREQWSSVQQMDCKGIPIERKVRTGSSLLTEP